MRRFFFIGIIFLAFSPGAQAQNEDLDIVQEPICFVLHNEAPYNVYGSFSTNYYMREDGIRARHRSNFKLEKAGSINEKSGYPNDRAEFCSYGPFWPGRKLELTLRTLVPIFSCQTRIDQGEIIIQGVFKPEGGTDTKALCFE